MSIQVKMRREAASFLSTFTGALGELIVDTTNRRVLVQDGITPGGIPANGAYAPNGSLLQLGVLEGASETITPGGLTYTSALQLPAGYKWILGAGWRVQSNITGPSGTLSLGVMGSPTAFINAASGLSLTAGSTTIYGQSGLRYDAAPISLLLTSSAGNFTAGAIRFVVHYVHVSPPTS